MSEAAASDDAAWRADIVARALGVLQHLLAQEVLAETVLVHASGSRLLHKLVELAATPLPLPALPRSGLLQEMNASANRTLLWTSQACGLAGPAVAERFDETKSIVHRNLGRVGGGKYDVAHVRMHALGASLAWQRHPTPPPAHLALCLACSTRPVTRFTPPRHVSMAWTCHRHWLAIRCLQLTSPTRIVMRTPEQTVE